MTKVDAPLVAVGLHEVPTAARAHEDAGYDGCYTFEGPHDPFLPLVLAAEHTERVDLMTAIAIAFARNPMTLAQIADDIQRASRGRMILGLGSQIRPHIEKRFSMPWSAPAARMRELVGAIRAIWRSWHEGEKLDFEGEFYTHTLMTPFFDPGPSDVGPARIALAGVGPKMTEVAGEVADVFFVHPFGSTRSFDELTLPALNRGTARSERNRSALEIAIPAIIALGDDDEELERNAGAVRAQLAFYGSTPAYRVVLDVHGWGELQTELNTLSKQGRWAEMSALVPQELVDEFSVAGSTDEVGSALKERFGSRVDRIALNAPYEADPQRWKAIADRIRAG